MRVRFAARLIAESENVVLLFEPGRYPVAYFPETDVSPAVLERTEHTAQHSVSIFARPRVTWWFAMAIGSSLTASER
jgi:hypothetical protein